MRATNAGRIIVGRDSITGRFIKVARAKSRKRTAEVERVRVKRLPSGRFA